ncbi:hypothetical protein AB0B79_18185 [Streptomyces sp. NPDC039022]|uniref:hypothetical protein n=1 Tax=Streptomyces sp. NPDC039022 TaxID=3157091 RepID=UPI0033C50D9A
MAIELSIELIKLEQDAVQAHEKLRAYQSECGRPTADDGWTDEQHATWQHLWEAWRTAAEAVHEALRSVDSRYETEQALKRAVRHPSPEEG